MTTPAVTEAINVPLPDPKSGHRREPSVPHEVKETLDAQVNENQDGERCLNNYILKEVIGHGAYGTVNLAIDKDTGISYAIKEFSKSRLRKKEKSHMFRRGLRGRGGLRSAVGNHDNPLHLIKEEVAILKKLNHPNVVKLFEVMDDPDNDSLYMVFEICEKGVLMEVSVHKKATPLPETKLRGHFREMILGFEYLHENNIVHRDIKPDNLLLSSGDVLKIVDFGVSAIFEGNDKLKKSAGSPAFMAPELCKAHHGEVSGKATDLWSMGVTLYCLAFGTLPFEKDNLIDLYESIKNDDPYIPPGTDPNLVDLLSKILDKSPETRITMKDLRVHPWVTENGANPLISTKENCAVLVTVTDEEIRGAIKSIAGLVVVMNAVRKFKRGSRHHATSSDLASLKAIADKEGVGKTKSDIDEITESLSTIKVTKGDE